MARSLQCLSCVAVVFIASCATPAADAPDDEIEDVRLNITHCPVHNELLIETVQPVDWERGQYAPSYWTIRSALFPCAFNDPHSWGDIALVTFCPKCRAAKAKFLNEDMPLPNQEELDAFVARHRRELDAEFARSR